MKASRFQLTSAFARSSLLGYLIVAATVSNAADNRTQSELAVQVTSADRVVANEAAVVHRHAKPVRGLKGLWTRAKLTSPAHKNAIAGTAAARATLAPADVRYPGDVRYLGGPVVDYAEQHAIYMLPNGKCPISSCWGDPEGFLRDLSRSEFIHVVDQYVGTRGHDRYPLGVRSSVSFAGPRNFTTPTLPFTDADMMAVVHAVASQTGQTGYGHIYHVFLPPGTDVCFDSTFSSCYSPDNEGPWLFCAYHSSVDFADIGHVLYSVEPYQNVASCNVAPGTPNGQLQDSTNTVLSHEVFETITDPDGNAWFNVTDVALLFDEIADECEFITFPSPSFWAVNAFRTGGKTYVAEPEYDNSQHACTIER